MNEFLPSRFVERVHRLALGIEPTDPMRRTRIGHPVEVAVDGTPVPRGDPLAAPWEERDGLRRVRRNDACRHFLLVSDGVEDPVDVRFLDRLQRYVPRRLRIRLTDPLAGSRVVRPALFPGAAYDVPAGAVGIRGRIVRGGAPMRWARVVATRTADGAVVGRAHGDHAGEFVLLLGAGAATGADLAFPLAVRVTVFGPDVAPDPAAVPGSAVDPLWDLALETVPLPPAPDRVSMGEDVPPGYATRPGSSRVVEFGMHGLGREEFDFS